METGSEPKVVFDEPKRLANIDKHGLDFLDVAPSFFLDAVFRPSHSGRTLAIGRMKDGRVVTVVYRPLGSQAVSIVSMRRASPAERRLLG